MSGQNTLTSQAQQQALDDSTSQQIQAVLDYCLDQVNRLIEMWYLEEVMTEQQILALIDDYLKDLWKDILDFLWQDGKTFIAMNSAEKFWDIFTQKLWVSTDRITKIKISTYSNGQSSWKDISQDSKEEILTQMWLSRWDRVLIIEDLIDTWNTLKRLVEFMEWLWVEVKIVCLFDKWAAAATQVKESLWDKLSNIIDVADNFILGFWMDYEERMFAGIPWLMQVTPGKEVDFTTKITLESLNIIKEIKARKKEIQRLLSTPLGN